MAQDGGHQGKRCSVRERLVRERLVRQRKQTLVLETLMRERSVRERFEQEWPWWERVGLTLKVQTPWQNNWG